MIIEYKGWKIKPLICYDLRFPVWARNTSDYDILLYVASWPKLRINAWDALLKARAIENMCYCVGVNRVGLDEKEIILHASLDTSHIKKTRNALPFLVDKDSFKLL